MSGCQHLKVDSGGKSRVATGALWGYKLEWRRSHMWEARCVSMWWGSKWEPGEGLLQEDREKAREKEVRLEVHWTIHRRMNFL